ncbi:MAG: Stp1/IreP family PP2C-type Ser/Thr phosphatase [Candidatus Aminicenantes bacterium]|nr:Stp1/IreP family PP2C-type Ser/Thr phosphatase [Candidatus Aminicenantes bacterium]
MRIRAFGYTDIGKKRRINEDDFICIQLVEKNSNEVPVYLLAVADGIGGHAGGEFASALAVETLREKIPFLLNKGRTPELCQMILEASFQDANRRIFHEASQRDYLAGMGTTLVAALVCEATVVLANIGDSRAYRISSNEINQLTLDHSWKAEQIRSHLMTEFQAQQSPFRNMVTRSLGFGTDVLVDIFHVDFNAGEYLLLCTDGLYAYTSDSQIVKIFHKFKTPEKVCRRLVKLANQHGGHDNITGVVAFFEGEDKKE